MNGTNYLSSTDFPAFDHDTAELIASDLNKTLRNDFSDASPELISFTLDDMKSSPEVYVSEQVELRIYQ